MHDMKWLKIRDLLKEGCIPITEFDKMTNKRIERLIKLQEKRLEEQQKYMEQERRKQEREAKKVKVK